MTVNTGAEPEARWGVAGGGRQHTAQAGGDKGGPRAVAKGLERSRGMRDTVGTPWGTENQLHRDEVEEKVEGHDIGRRHEALG